VITIPADILDVVHELAHDLRKDSDGGRKLTVSEALALAEKLLKLGTDIASLAKSHG